MKKEAWVCDRCGHHEEQDASFWAKFKYPPLHSKIIDGEKCGGTFGRPVSRIGRKA